MATVPDAAAASGAEDAAERELKRAELQWKIRVAKADVVQKILISIVGVAIAGIFYVFQANQTESRYYSELQAQRERADADLRASMFKTLFEVYFKNKIEAAQKAATRGDTPARAEALFINLGQEIMLSDLLSRNFESMDVRPLFEDLDRRLTDLMERGGEGQKVLPGEAFRQREQLRRVARGASTRQIELLRANARARVQQVRIQQCQHSPSSQPVFTPDELPPLPDNTRGLIKRVADGSVIIALSVPTVDTSARVASPDSPNSIVEAPPSREVPVTVTFFDMPTLENVRLADGRRVALTLMRSASTRTCERFSPQMDETARLDCNPQPDDDRKRPGVCVWTEVWITLIPKDYIGMRDRPYLSELYSPLFQNLRKLVSE